MVRTGAYAYVRYGWEDDDSPNVFGGTATQIANSFGQKTAVTGWTLTTNRTNLGKLGQVEPVSYAYGQQAGTLGIGFVLSDTTSHEIFRNFYGTAAGVGSSPTKYIYGLPANDTPTVPTAGGLKNFVGNSFTTEIGFDTAEETSNEVRTLKGCVCNAFTISAAIGGTVDCSADIVYGKEDPPSVNFNAANNPTENGKPFTFAHGQIYLSDGSGNASVIGEVQDIDINFTQNAELLYQLGSNQAVDGIKKVLDITGRLRISWNNHNALDAVLAQLKGANYKETWGDKYAVGTGDKVELKVYFSNGLSGTSERSIKLQFDGLSITDHNVTGLEPVEPVFEEFNWQAKNAKVIAIYQ